MINSQLLIKFIYYLNKKTRAIKEILQPSFLWFLGLSIVVEIIGIIFFNFTFKSPVTNSIPKISESSEANVKIGIESLARLLGQRVEKIAFNLLFIGKHINIFGDNNENGSNSKASNFYSSSSDCLIPVISTSDLFRNSNYFKYYNKTTDSFEYLDNFLIEFNETSLQDEIIQKMLNKPLLNQISYYNSKGQNSISQLSTKFITSACTTISIMKVLYIKEFITFREKSGIDKLVIIKNETIMIYPPNAFTNTFLYQKKFFDNNQCIIGDNSNFPKCLNLISLFEENQNKLIFPKFKYVKGKVNLSICIKMKFENINEGYNSILCGEVYFNSFFQNFKFQGGDTLSMGFFNQEILEKEGNINYFYKAFFTNIDINKTVYNDPSFGNYQLNESNEEPELFHLFYNDIFSQKKHINKSSIIKEYDNEIKSEITKIINGIEDKISNNQYDNFTEIKTFIKTFPYNETIKNKTKFTKDEYLMGITPIIINYSNVDNRYLMELNEKSPSVSLFYAIVIVKLTPDYYTNWLENIFLYKNIRLFVLFIVLCCFLSLTFYIHSLKFFDFLLSSINVIQRDCHQYNNPSELNYNKFLLLSKTERMKNLEQEKKLFDQFLVDHKNAKNREMFELEKTFETMKKIIFLKRIITHNNLQYHKKNFVKFLETINDEEIKQISTLILAYSNFQEGKYFSAMKEIDSLIHKLWKKNSKILTVTDNFDSQIKDMIKRFSEISYLNEYSNFKGFNENILPVIKEKQLSQKLFYLFALCKYRHIVESKGNLVQRPFYGLNNILPLEESIDYFKRVRTINHSIGINPIKEIYSLIMLAKCNIYQHDYKNAKNILNEALLTYNEILKLFKDNSNKYYLPKIMLFVLNHIFQNIMLTIAQCLYENNKLCNAGFLCFKIFETSPFLHKTIHMEASYLLCKILKDLKADYSVTSNMGEGSGGTGGLNIKLRKKTSDVQEISKIKHLLDKKSKLFDKIYSRLMIKSTIIKKKDLNNSTSTNNATTYKETKAINTNFGNDALFINNSSKEIIICLSENVIKSFKGSELQDVITKYLQEFFINNENDFFSFIQFSSIGSKTIYLKQLAINEYIQKLKFNKNNKIIHENQQNNKIQFNQLFNLLDGCIKIASNDIKSDNIILLFIESEDFRFSSKKECLDIVHELNEGNFTLIIFSCEELINDNKIQNIKMFLSGLIEGYFLHVKNYQIIKQVFMSIANHEKMEDFFVYEYENSQNILL